MALKFGVPLMGGIIALAVGLAGAVVQAGEPPPQTPFLRIDPGMHTAQIRRIGVDAKCSRLVTGADDKTARIWDITDRTSKTPTLLRTLRVPIGPENGGKVSAVTMSPDGKLVAAGGWDAEWASTGLNNVYVFEAATGRLIQRLGGLQNVIKHLTYSPDNRYIAVTLGAGQGVRVWETKTWQQVLADTDYDADSYGAAFDNAGRLWTVADDGRMRRYDPDGNGGFASKPKSVFTQGGREPYSVASHPASDRVAVGYADTTAVEVYESASLNRLFAADTQNADNGDLSTVAWSSDGSRLYAGGLYDIGGFSQLRVWERSGQGKPTDIKGPRDSIADLLTCGNQIALGGADPVIGLFNADDTRAIWMEPVKPDMRNKLRKHFRVGSDGRDVWYGLAYGSQVPVHFDFDAARLYDAPKTPKGLSSADTESLAVERWEDNKNPALNGSPLVLNRDEGARSVAIAPNKKMFVLGADWSLRAYDTDGKELWNKNVPGAAWGVNIPHDGRTVVVAYHDGTIRWHRLSDGKELLALFVHTKDRRWVMWTPTGYYNASPGGEELIGWHINAKTWNKEASFYEAHLFRNQFYRPDIVRLMLETLDEEKSIDQANGKAKQKRGSESIRELLPPVIKIISPAPGVSIDQQVVRLTYTATTENGAKISDVEIRIDGRPIATRALAVPDDPSDASNQITVDVPVPARDATISLIAWSTDGKVKRASDAASVSVIWKGAKSEVQNLPRLLALVIGVSDYADDRLDLNYADDDAIALEAAFQAQRGITYSTVETRLLTDSDATRSEILRGLNWLKNEAQNDDIVMISFAGHGLTDTDRSFYFLPHEADPDEPTIDGIGKERLREMIRLIRGKVVIFMDACFAADGLATPGKGLGPADMTGIATELGGADVGAIMYAASTGRQFSQEGEEFGGHGAFTKALLEGLAGAANKYPPAAISTGELDSWLTFRVAQLTNNAQTPTMVKSQVPHFALASATQ